MVRFSAFVPNADGCGGCTGGSTGGSGVWAPRVLDRARIFVCGVGGGGVSPLFPRRLCSEDDVPEVSGPLTDGTNSDDNDIFFDAKMSHSPISTNPSPLEESFGSHLPPDEGEEVVEPKSPPPEEQLGSFWDEQGRHRSWRLRNKRLVVGEKW